MSEVIEGSTGVLTAGNTVDTLASVDRDAAAALPEVLDMHPADFEALVSDDSSDAPIDILKHPDGTFELSDGKRYRMSVTDGPKTEDGKKKWEQITQEGSKSVSNTDVSRGDDPFVGANPLADDADPLDDENTFDVSRAEFNELASAFLRLTDAVAKFNASAPHKIAF